MFKKLFACLSMLMNFIGAKCLSNDLIGTRNMAIFVLFCKRVHLFMQVNMHKIE